MMKFLCLFLALCCTSIGFSQLKINEYSSNKGLIDDGEETDWIEIVNTSGSEIQLSDYYISDKIDDPQKWNFPSYTMAADEILLVCASGKNITTKIDHWESLVLAENNWQYFIGDSEPPSNWTDTAFDDSSWASGIGGFGYADDDDNTILENPISSVYIRQNFTVVDISDLQNMVLHADYDDGYVAYINGVEISRSDNLLGNPPPFDAFTEIDHEAGFYQGIVPDPISFDIDQINDLLVEGENVLSIQLHNAAATSSDMTGIFYLSAGIISATVNYFPIPAWFTPSSNNDYYHTNFKLSAGEHVLLSDLTSTIDLDPITEDMQLGISKGRSPDGIGDWCFFDTPSPNTSNGPSWCFDGVTPKPAFSLESGWYAGDQTTSISSPNSVIYITSNGDIPDETDAEYLEAIPLTETAIVSARAYSNDNLLPSPVVDRIYIFGQDNHDLPVFSIVTDYDNLWDWDEGIYVSGPGASADYPYYGSNFWQPWSKFARVEFFDGDKEKQAEEYLDLEIHGGWSRAEIIKSFRLDFKSSYTGRLEYPLFEQKPEIESYNNINLRNGGQHFAEDKMQDAFIGRLVNETHCDNMAYEPCILYLNGEYWGVYGIREKIDEHYIESNHGTPSGELDLLNSWGILAGSDQHIIETYSLLSDEPANSSDFYPLIDQRFDIENYIDYFIIQTFIQNVDWMGIAWGLNNVKLWRPQTENGKWRYVLYDTDGGLGYFGQSFIDNYLAAARNPSNPTYHSILFDKFLTNEQFKCEFANRYADLMNTTFRLNNVQSKANSIETKMFDAMPDHISRWGGPLSMSFWTESIDQIVEYTDDRILFARSQVNGNLELQGQVDITLDVFPLGAGTIQISTVTPDAYPWTGVYFNGCPVKIEAIAAEGYSFNHWSENDLIGGESTDTLLELPLYQDDVFIANFDQDPNSISELNSDDLLQVFPNPTDDLFTIVIPSVVKKNYLIEVYNTVGEKVFEISSNNVNTASSLKIDLGDFASGLYSLSLKTEDISYVKKLILR